MGSQKTILTMALSLPIGSIVVPFWVLPERILAVNHKKELLWSLWVLPERILNISHKKGATMHRSLWVIPSW